MLEVLRLSPEIRLADNKCLTVKSVRPPAKAFSLHAEAQLSGSSDGVEDESVAVIFGPANGAISEKVVLEAAKEAKQKEYNRLLVIAFAIEPPARKTVADCENLVGVPALYVQASTDLTMSDLLKNMRASEVFAVCGMPEIELKFSGKQNNDGEELYQATLSGLDVFDPVTRETKSERGDDVPCWMLDTDYDGYCFRAGQVFFPKTEAWDKLKRALGSEWDDSVWSHLAGTTSEPFVLGENKQIAVKVIDERGNELMVVKRITEIN